VGGVVVAFLVFGALYDRRAKRLGRSQLDPKEPSREHRRERHQADGGWGDGF
jgi:hypothetical protein